MKKIIIISIIAVFSLNSFSQKSIIGGTVNLTLNPGIYYVSNPIKDFYVHTKKSDLSISLYSAFEYAKYKNIDVELFKLAVGTSIFIPNFAEFSTGESINFSLLIAPNFNYSPKLNAENYQEFSLEIGLTAKIVKDIYFTFIIDPFQYNDHFKLGLGIEI